MGQELTARTKYRGLLKRRLVPVAVEGPLPAPGTPVAGRARPRWARCAPAGTGSGIAQLRLEALDGRPLRCGEAAVVPRLPGWMVLPAAASPGLTVSRSPPCRRSGAAPGR